MKILRVIPVVLALAASGCLLVSGQFLVSLDLEDVNVTSPSTVVGVDVDLSDEPDYRDHKENLKGLADEALVGFIRNNNSAEPLDVQIWITPDTTSFTDDGAVHAAGVLAWGPLRLGADEEQRVDWDRSAALLTPAGRAVIEKEVKGDGSFTVYVMGAGGAYSLSVRAAKLLVIINAGV